MSGMIVTMADNGLVHLSHVRAALALQDFDSRAAQRFMEPRPRPALQENSEIPPKEAAVLLLVFPTDESHLSLVLTRRSANLRGHSGQISFPGGKRDPEDHSYRETALRETCEELGICDAVELLGELSPFYIPPSHFNVHPWVGTVNQQPVFKPNPDEVASVITFGLDDLLFDNHKHLEMHKFEWGCMNVPYYRVQGHKVWGATAVILSEFENRLRAVLAD